jgi:hypothetical protein
MIVLKAGEAGRHADFRGVIRSQSRKVRLTSRDDEDRLQLLCLLIVHIRRPQECHLLLALGEAGECRALRRRIGSIERGSTTPEIFVVFPLERHPGFVLENMDSDCTYLGNVHAAIGNLLSRLAKLAFDINRKYTTIWLWIYWVQHLRLCLIQPGGR